MNGKPSAILTVLAIALLIGLEAGLSPTVLALPLVPVSAASAIALNPDKIKESAKTDSIFEGLRGQKRFQALVG